MAEKLKLGELLIEAGLIDKVQLQSALAYQKKWNVKLGAALIDMRFISERDLASFLEQQLNTTCVSIMTKEIHPDVINAVKPEIAKKYGIFPLDVEEKVMTVATSDPLDLPMLDELSFRLGKRIRPQLALDSEVKRAINCYYDNIREEQMRPPAPREPIIDRIELSRAGMGTEKRTETDLTARDILDALITVLESKGYLRRSEIFGMIKKQKD